MEVLGLCTLWMNWLATCWLPYLTLQLISRQRYQPLQILTLPHYEYTLTYYLSVSLCPFQAPCQPVLKGTTSMSADTNRVDTRDLSCKSTTVHGDNRVLVC